MNGNVANGSVTSAPNVITSNVYTTQGVGFAINNEVVAIRTTILIILLLFSLTGNSFIVLSVAQASKVRFNPFNAFLLSLAAYGVVECAMTMSLAIGFSVEQKWIFGDFLKGFNASFIQMHNVGVMLTLAAMAMDRYIAVKDVSNYHTQSSVHRANYIVLYTWIHGFLFALPIMFQNQMLGVTARAFMERCLCGLVEGTTIVFTSLTIALCFAIPFLAAMVFLCLIILRSIKERKNLVSSNNTQFADCLFQESALLKEARCTQYVTLLILMFLLFKVPYITVDVLTQLSVSFAYHSVNSTNYIPSNANDNHTQFYYQTALVWMLFCFSALYPIVTFIYFNDHWRRLRSWLICGTSTISIANRHGNGANLRHIRHKQKRNEHHKRMANRNSNINNNIGIKHATKASTVSRHKKAPSTISSNITTEKVAVNGLSAKGPEVLFRVPVLYAATDGLHLVASEKTLGRKYLKGKEDVSLQNHPISSSATIQSQAVKLNQSFSATCPTSVSQPEHILKRQDMSNVRPSSVVDTRVDVTGSIDGVNEEEMSYFMSVAEIDNDTESELNDSVNSRTLIWPHQSSFNGKSTSVWAEMTTQSSYQNKFGDHFDENDNSNLSVSHPNTPTPPGDEEGSQTTAILNSNNLFDSHKTVINKTVLNKLPAIKSQNNFVEHSPSLSGSSQNGLLLVESLEECGDGILNTGYETTSNLQFKTNVVLPNESFGHSKNKVHPKSGSLALLLSTSNGGSAWNVDKRCHTNSVQVCTTSIGQIRTKPEGEILYTTTETS